MLRTLSLLVVAAAVPLGLLSADPLETAPLQIETDDAVHGFTVEIADDQDEISYGLMERESLAEDAGMLFDFDGTRETSMWMKNTLIPLDMLFVDSDGTIVMIARDTVPGSLRSISPGVPVRAVLELNGGTAEALDITPGDTLVHPIFGNAGE